MTRDTIQDPYVSTEFDPKSGVSEAQDHLPVCLDIYLSKTDVHLNADVL